MCAVDTMSFVKATIEATMELGVRRRRAPGTWSDMAGDPQMHGNRRDGVEIRRERLGAAARPIGGEREGRGGGRAGETKVANAMSDITEVGGGSQERVDGVAGVGEGMFNGLEIGDGLPGALVRFIDHLDKSEIRAESEDDVDSGEEEVVISVTRCFVAIQPLKLSTPLAGSRDQDEIRVHERILVALYVSQERAQVGEAMSVNALRAQAIGSELTKSRVEFAVGKDT